MVVMNLRQKQMIWQGQERYCKRQQECWWWVSWGPMPQWGMKTRKKKKNDDNHLLSMEWDKSKYLHLSTFILNKAKINRLSLSIFNGLQMARGMMSYNWHFFSMSMLMFFCAPISIAIMQVLFLTNLPPPPPHFNQRYIPLSKECLARTQTLPSLIPIPYSAILLPKNEYLQL